MACVVMMATAGNIGIRYLPPEGMLIKEIKIKGKKIHKRKKFLKRGFLKLNNDIKKTMEKNMWFGYYKKKK